MSVDPYRALTAQTPGRRADGSTFPSASSSRSNKPISNYGSCTSSPRPTSSRVSSHPTTSISELSQYFNRHTIQPQRRSTPNPLDHAHTHAPQGLYRPHDPTDLAILSTTHAHRIARRKQSMRGLQCNPKQLHRVASLVEDMMVMEDKHNQERKITSPLSPPQSPDVDTEAEDGFSSASASATPTPDSSLSSTSSSSSYSYFSFNNDNTAPTAAEAAGSNHEKKVLKPIRMRKRPIPGPGPGPGAGRRRGESFNGGGR